MSTTFSGSSLIIFSHVGSLCDDRYMGHRRRYSRVSECYAVFTLYTSVNGWQRICLTYGGHELIGRGLRRCLKSLTFLNSLMQATEPTERTDPQCIPRAHAKSMRSVNGGVQCERSVRGWGCSSCQGYWPSLWKRWGSENVKSVPASEGLCFHSRRRAHTLTASFSFLSPSSCQVRRSS
jgi:hypothetical protein